MKKYDNPWNLTRAQARAMDAICTHGCHKLAANALGLSIKTIEAHSTQAGFRMRSRTMLQKYLEWDRWMRNRASGSTNRHADQT